MQQECKELLQMLSASLQAGYSVERAFSDAERELEAICDRDSLLLAELRKMNRLVKVSRPVEDVFLDLAEKTGLDTFFGRPRGPGAITEGLCGIRPGSWRRNCGQPRRLPP